MDKVYFKLLGLGLGLTMMVSVFSAIGSILQVGTEGMLLTQIGGFLISAVFLSFYMRKHDPSLKQFGFEKKAVSPLIYGFIVVVIFIQPLVLGIDFSLSLSTILLVIVQMFLVGFVEETLFRGIFYYFLKNKPVKVFIVFSSVVFGMLHLASGLNPEIAPLLVLLQVINALLLGGVFAVIYYRTQTIYSVIVFHGLFNIFASISLPGSLQSNLVAVGLLTVCYLLFLGYYGKKILKLKA